jgi:carboxymethylenebutenolidase
MLREDSYADAVTAAYVTIDCGGEPLPAYYAAPRNAGAETPSLVMAMHLTGVDAQQRDTARRFAAEGFATVVPDLYARFGAPDGDVEDDYRAFLPFTKLLTFETVDRDIRAATAWIRSKHPRISTVIAGFCMGGVMAVRRTHGYADIFSAGAVWYGRVSDVDPATIDIPIVASFGSADQGIPLESVHAFAAGLTVANDVKVYDGAQHAFCDQRGDAYDGTAAEDSWRRSITFLRSHALLRRAESDARSCSQ